MASSIAEAQGEAVRRILDLVGDHVDPDGSLRAVLNPRSTGKAADDGDEEAIDALTDRAAGVGIDPDSYATWENLEKAIEKAEAKAEKAEAAKAGGGK